MSRARSFVHEWIDLVERSGLLVSEPVLHRFFPGGPEHVEPRQQRALLSAWERFQVDPSDGQRQSAWLDAVLLGLLEWPEDRLARGPRLPPSAAVHLPELDQSLRPSAVLTGDGDCFLLGVWRIGAEQKPDRVERIEGTWRATPAAKLERWLRESGTPFGLLTGGSAFRLVHVPPGLPASWIEFPASTFFEEQSVLDGFWSLLRAARFFGAAEGRLEHFAAESQKAQAELTESLGEQVRAAVEELILALDRADRGSGQHPLDIGTGGRIFLGHDPDEIYKAAVYIVMRLVFILFAEERSLLPHGNVFFDEGYGLGRLLHRLEEEKRTRPETFDREADAWPRLLALFRLIFLGSPHPDLPLPVYGGDLFSPTDFPALAALESEILRIPNRSVYAILRALTFGEAKVGKEKIAQRYSYRNLDVEHIGYLYEGLLDHHAARAGREPLVKLANGTEVAIRLSELEALHGEKLVSFLAERGVAGGDRGRIESWLAEPSAGAVAAIERLPGEVARRCRPYAGVIQTDEVVLPGRLYLTTSSSRRATGTHYTPIQYTRAMVTETLEPLVYVGEHGKLEEPRRLRSPRELLDLKVCDPAMGSGAFLVQVIRYLGEKLADSWQAERERHGEGVALYLPYAEPGAAREDRIPLPEERTDAELWAKRLVAERCVYGVDKNPLAVEMAKLSIWLVTLDHKKPFSFVNHALKPGDSLLGISSLGQLRSFSLSGEGKQLGLLEERIAQGAQRASQLRQQIGSLAVVTPADVAQKEQFLAEADREVRALWALADLLISTITRSKKPAEQEAARIELLARISFLLDSREELQDLARRESGGQSPLHWPLAFPEVFDREDGGFDAFIGNPPFSAGTIASTSLGPSYVATIRTILASFHGKADLVVAFLRRAAQLTAPSGWLTLLATSSILRGESLESGLRVLLADRWQILQARTPHQWPGKAGVQVVTLTLSRAWLGLRRLDGRPVANINEALEEVDDTDAQTPRRIESSIDAWLGIKLGRGNVKKTPDEVEALSENNSLAASVLVPAIGGDEIYSLVDLTNSPRSIDPALLKKLPREAQLEIIALTGAGEVAIIEHSRPASEMTQSCGESEIVFACGETSVHLNFRPIPKERIIPKHKLVLFPSAGWALLALLQSSLHTEWAWRWGLRREGRLVYSPKRCAQTFPLPPKEQLEQLEQLGQDVHALRSKLMETSTIGLTELYNRFHAPGNSCPDLDQLRHLQIKIDYEVARIYGWQDLDLGHGFFEIGYLAGRDRVRFSISPGARIKILGRLLRLNQDLYHEEAGQVFSGHDRKMLTAARPEVEAKRDNSSIVIFPAPAQPTLFPVSPQMEFWEVAEPTASPASERSYLADSPAATYGESHEAPSNGRSQHAAALLSWFRSSIGWRSRAEALAVLEFSTPEWSQAIQELLEAGLVERTGEKRGTRYRAKL